MATGSLYDIRKFLQADFSLENAKIVYCSSLINVDALDQDDSDDGEDEDEDEDDPFFKMVGGNLYYNYNGSLDEFKELFGRFNLELIV